MSFRSYETYRESGIRWLGRVPKHWTDKRLRFVAKLNPSKSEISDLPRETAVTFLPMEAIGEDGSLDLQRTRPLGEMESGYTYFREGDVVVAKITPCFENGKGAIMCGLQSGIGFGTTELIVARPYPTSTTNAYLNWIFISDTFRQLGESWMYGAGGQKRVPDDFVRDFAIAFPPLQEQVAIAAFLDRETGKIDALVEEQRRLIELLKEKRQAVISHAVTKGLDPTAPMKDSGVEWLGDVPAHWELLSLKRDMQYLTSGARGWAEYYADEGPIFIRIGNLTRQGIDLDLSDIQRVAVPMGAESERTRVRPGDLLFSITAYLGSVAVVPEGFEDAYVSQHVALCRLRYNILTPLWVALLTSSWVGQTYLATQGYGGTKIQLSLDDVANLLVTVPPKSEQAVIISFLFDEVGKFDRLVDEAQIAITLLQERRAALISAAVTGKIDVRRLVSTETEAP